MYTETQTKQLLRENIYVEDAIKSLYPFDIFVSRVKRVSWKYIHK